MPRKRSLVFAAVAAGFAAYYWNKNSNSTFRDRVVVITGGSRGLGLVLARRFAKEGAQLALLARRTDELDRAKADLSARGAAVMTVSCDIRDPGQIEAAVARVADHYGRIDVLINNAGVIQVGPLRHMQRSDFEDAMATHFWGPLDLTLAVLPWMRRQGGGRIVNIASIGGKLAVPHLAPYTASKFALVGLSDALQAELAAENIRVTTVSPGLMRTGSHVRAEFKGNHRWELAWFSASAALPLASFSAERAASQIVEACRKGKAELIISPQARALARLRALTPGLTARASAAAGRLLPAPVGRAGDRNEEGSRITAPSWLSSVTVLIDRAARRNNEVA